MTAIGFILFVLGEIWVTWAVPRWMEYDRDLHWQEVVGFLLLAPGGVLLSLGMALAIWRLMP
jgi:cytochrome b subunit of formate dehydrogenase